MAAKQAAFVALGTGSDAVCVDALRVIAVFDRDGITRILLDVGEGKIHEVLARGVAPGQAQIAMHRAVSSE